MMAASVSAGPGAAVLAVTARDSLFGDMFAGDMGHANYAVTPDGRFAMLEGRAAGGPVSIVVLGWLPELRAALGAAQPAAPR
jgi:hypothetical protein